MMTRLIGAGLGLLGCLGTVGSLPACGDKFLVASRGTRYQRAPLTRLPASILIYSRTAGQLPGRGEVEGIEEILRKNGYTPTMAGSATEFDRALGRGGWDLVVVGIADAAATSRRLPERAGLMPVLVNPTAEEMKLSRKEYPVVLKAPAKSQAVLDAVDRALAARKKTAKGAKPAA